MPPRPRFYAVVPRDASGGTGASRRCEMRFVPRDASGGTGAALLNSPSR